MRIHIATDHAGMELSAFLVKELSLLGHEMVDHGPTVYDALDDYPGFCIACAQGVVGDQLKGIEALGIVLGGSGNGEQIAANKVAGVRAALIWNPETAALARDHNDANVCALGARQHSQAEVLELVKIFIAAGFSDEERHVRRIDKISLFEQTGLVSY
ncbi:ribose-5-phosphate isomerase [Candidatus Aquiluna sp. UB-MaderosW2red]|jgi:ribose 5-phosphate isomerase B|uniref:ribose-5-phosphate isomerase n=1 Tax=Candidatus Aquiluna sp. UB-MaderosW2red TaxID=1855377 RepID=UPI000875C9B2|nr:ribose-5-phosphate isomerase [Candidatus Aquiluna sp. UB-MaderosW2red]SCX10241.1 ribose 5-phosphate isomerase B [Candidatus Aquiluna sp. UB-MaderosW2red]